MTTAEKLTTIAENVEKVYEAGAKSAYDEFWDGLQNYGNRTVYSAAFSQWAGATSINPKYPIAATELYNTFSGCSSLESVPTIVPSGEYFASLYSAFYQCGALKSVDFELIVGGTRTDALNNTFLQCSALERIYKITLLDSITANFTANFLNQARNLVEVTFDGVIKTNGLNVTNCRNLSHDSLMSIINTLEDKTSDTSGTTWKVAIGSANIAKLTESELAVAENKGWVVA